MHDGAASARATDAPVPHRAGVRNGKLDVMIVDDHPVFAQALALAIGSSGALRCAGVASTATEALALADEAHPDAVVMDLGLGDDDGISLTRELTSRHRGLRVLVLTGRTPSAGLVQASADAGASGFLPKAASLGAVVDAIAGLTTECFTMDRQMVALLCETVSASTTPAPRQSHPADALTRRERDILELLVNGVDLHTASVRLGISVNTSRGYVKNLYRKLGVHTQLELLAVARKRGLIGDQAD